MAKNNAAPAAAPQPLTVWPAQAFLSTVRVGIDINGDVWQFQGTSGVVKIGTGTGVPQIASDTQEK